MRSHTENVNAIDYMPKTDTLVTASSAECSVKIWDHTTKEQIYEFSTNNDYPDVLACHPIESYVAVGYKSGFVRIFDTRLSEVIYENMIFESSIKDLRFSKEGRLLAAIYETSRIVIFDVEKEFQPIKTFDYDFPNNNYFSLDFSDGGHLLANLSTNANTITIWETINFTLRYEIDLTGNLLLKLRFAPNGKDLVVLTTTSKFKFFRIGLGEVSEYKNVPGIHDYSCIDFEISPNNKYIVTCGKDGIIKAFDYFMRGNTVMPASQAFIGHKNFPFKLCWGGSNKGDKIYSLAEHNGIFEWEFHGESAAHMDYREIQKHYENIVGEEYRVDKGGIDLNINQCRPSEIIRSMKLKNQKLEEAKRKLNLRQTVNAGRHKIGDDEEEDPRTLEINPYQLPPKGSHLQNGDDNYYTYNDTIDLARDNHDRFYPEEISDRGDYNGLQATFGKDSTFMRASDRAPATLRKDLHNYYSRDHPGRSLDPIIQSNLLNYKYEAIDITMSHSMAYSCTYKQKQNLTWHQENKWIGYTFESVVIIEQLNVERTQRFLKEGNDTLSDLKLSPNGKLLMAYTYNASVDGMPMIYIWDSTTFKKVAEIAINQRNIVTAEISPNSNILLVVSFDDTDDDDPNSIVAIWDIFEGQCEPFCRSHVPWEIQGATWNYFIKGLEFVTWSKASYCFWKVSEELVSLHYQDGVQEFDVSNEEGKIKADSPSAILLGKDEQSVHISTMNFAYPVSDMLTVFLLIGLSNGYVWTVDSRTNSLLSQVKISDTCITHITPKQT